MARMFDLRRIAKSIMESPSALRLFVCAVPSKKPLTVIKGGHYARIEFIPALISLIAVKFETFSSLFVGIRAEQRDITSRCLFVDNKRCDGAT